jgi:hypothetical protein
MDRRRETGGHRPPNTGNRFAKFDQREAVFAPRFTVVKPGSSTSNARVAAALNDDDSSDNEVF